MSDGKVLTGLDVLTSDLPAKVRGRVGLVTNQAAVNRHVESSIDTLLKLPQLELAALFGPEHGVYGAAQAGEHVSSGIDEQTGVPTYSLYGATRKPTAEMLQGLDILVLDLPDVGARYWTFLYTMAYCLQAAAEQDIPIAILDRPNPIGGERLEGNVLDPAYSSFVGMYPIPMRHGMTLGEVAALFNNEYCFGAELIVIKCRNWQRTMLFGETGLPFVPPSPNTPTPDSLLLYPGTCLIEGTVLSEGRGTTKPFEVIGAPWINPFKLAADLNRRNLRGVRFRPTYFVPTFSKHQGELCGGVQVHVQHPREVNAVSVGVNLLEAVHRMYPDNELWRPPFSTDSHPFIDLLAGTDALRAALDAGEAAQSILSTWESQWRNFDSVRHKYLLYS